MCLFLGKTAGNLHNIQRSIDLQRNVNSIGIHDNENRSILRPSLIEEHGGENIQVYQAPKEFAEYRILEKNCLSFAKYIVGDHSEKLNKFDDFSFFTHWLWEDKCVK